MEKNLKIIILKIGGSFFRKDTFPYLLENLKTLSLLKKQKLLIVTGGGKEADLIRNFDHKYNLNDSSAHFAAIAAMEINAHILSSFLDDYSFFTLEDGKITKEKIKKENINIFLPAAYYRKYDPLPNSWDISSDSIAYNLAEKINADELILLKAKDPFKLEKEEFNKINYQEVESLMEENLIDKYFPILFKEKKIKTIIINGRFKNRLKDYLNNKEVILTKIIE